MKVIRVPCGKEDYVYVFSYHRLRHHVSFSYTPNIDNALQVPDSTTETLLPYKGELIDVPTKKECKTCMNSLFQSSYYTPIECKTCSLNPKPYKHTNNWRELK